MHQIYNEWINLKMVLNKRVLLVLNGIYSASQFWNCYSYNMHIDWKMMSKKTRGWWEMITQLILTEIVKCFFCVLILMYQQRKRMFWQYESGYIFYQQMNYSNARYVNVKSNSWLSIDSISKMTVLPKNSSAFKELSWFYC